MFPQKPQQAMRFLALGDVIGRPGRKILSTALPILRRVTECDGVIVNVENAAGGFGVTPETYEEFLDMEIDVMTSGNHVFDKKGFEDWMDRAGRLLRPANFPAGTVGKGYDIFEIAGRKVGVVNVMGRVFMKAFDCPFHAVDHAIEEIEKETHIIFVDIHAEATSEKNAMGWYCAGRVSGVWGTHTHVPTADARILDEFTGYQTDLGMTGPYNSVIGMAVDPVIEGFLSAYRNRFEPAKGDLRVGGCMYDIDPESGKCLGIQGFLLSEKELQRLQDSRKTADTGVV